jgi:tripeptide aminopeptidase
MKTLKKILAIQSESGKQWRMFAYIVRRLTGAKIQFYVEEGNIYAFKGQTENAPCIVAHMDTVHSICEDLTVLECGDFLTGFNRIEMKQSGIGGDDKVGVYIALEALDHFDNISACFFRDEEIGCGGSRKANMEFFNKTSFVLQCDRKGNGDFINKAGGTVLTSKAFNKEVGKIIKTYDYKFEHGMMTDVMTLKENGLKVACANMSCGYYRPHCNDEYVSKTDVVKCKDMVFEIFTKLGAIRFEHLPEPAKYSNYGGRFYDWNDGFDYTPYRESSFVNKLLPSSNHKAAAIRKRMEDRYDKATRTIICDGCSLKFASIEMKYIRDWRVWFCTECNRLHAPIEQDLMRKCDLCYTPLPQGKTRYIQTETFGWQWCCGECEHGLKQMEREENISKRDLFDSTDNSQGG